MWALVLGLRDTRAGGAQGQCDLHVPGEGTLGAAPRIQQMAPRSPGISVLQALGGGPCVCDSQDRAVLHESSGKLAGDSPGGCGRVVGDPTRGGGLQPRRSRSCWVLNQPPGLSLVSTAFCRLSPHPLPSNSRRSTRIGPHGGVCPPGRQPSTCGASCKPAVMSRSFM